ncbi:4-hydroxythreonine-4-phosphate dehydrogenase PdxA [Magnetospirillum sulfuroxidans]|uniref:4-hydroxythreonine-4-phosphate dehydrogenase n=1 Tax=Magnetospirillum sulfuroxidans TaxID=611300 RepID=A0ABS5IFU4_9PROT|nr:4-hydroxythreonine-4-phosphate dehydrogenase PdxA [Magnetospirillum sulfuroxidans]MBR9973280.1 4-hydroxythreonine-4-phosphate dehydrogenase PdxA [Magnetospirillum sulfuroxidans]
MTNQPPLALTMGEPAGIGGELSLKAWRQRQRLDRPFLVLDDPERLRELADGLGWDVPIASISAPEQAAAVFAQALPVLPHPLTQPVTPGRPDPANTQTVLESIARAVQLATQGRVAALVTNPINKAVLYQGGFGFPGHTEYLAHLLGQDGQEVMMLACPQLRVVPVTIHLSLAQAIAGLTTQAIVHAGRVTAAALRRDFAVATPRLAVAGLNPHAGENGAMGHEDADIVAPAIAELRRHGIDAIGPLPADTLFHARARATYDAALCMYHDQALIPIKTIDFDGGVNVTLGLPIIRTSPDHGTAFALAGTGQAVETSLMAALNMAAAMATNRSRHLG